VKERSRCGAPGVALNAPKPDEIPSGVRGNRDEAMTVRQREPIWELNPSGSTGWQVVQGTS